MNASLKQPKGEDIDLIIGDPSNETRCQRTTAISRLTLDQISSMGGEIADLSNSRSVHILRMFILAEYLLWESVSNRKSNPAKFLRFHRQKLRQDCTDGVYWTPKDTGVDQRLISAACSLLSGSCVKLCNKEGRLIIKSGWRKLPSCERVKERLESEFSQSLLPQDFGRAWDEAFPEHPWKIQEDEYSIYKCLLSIFGIELHWKGRTSTRKNPRKTLRINMDSVNSLLKDTCKFAPRTLKPIFSEPTPIVDAEEKPHPAYKRRKITHDAKWKTKSVQQTI